jgi:glycosyltransferase involved in cell wall biosynthesis
MNRKKKSILLVTFPVDLGNRTIESNLHELLKTDMDFYRFASRNAGKLDKGVNYKRSVMDRLISIVPLSYRVLKSRLRGDFILFNGLSPAFLSMLFWQPKSTGIMFDWTRLLYPSVLGHELHKGALFKLHRFVLKRCKVILCWTDAIVDNLIEHYDVNPSQIVKVPAPFLVDNMNLPPRKTPKLPRVLFIGGDLQRKGGEIVLKSYEKRLKDKCQLTMLTPDNKANVEGIIHLAKVKYGTQEHLNVFEQNDILILPTKIDAYAQVLGEAAAAGLAIVTSKYALGAPEIVIDGITGFITESPEEVIDKLLYLLDCPGLVDSFKLKGYQKMHNQFSKNNIRDAYLEAINNARK